MLTWESPPKTAGDIIKEAYNKALENSHLRDSLSLPLSEAFNIGDTITVPAWKFTIEDNTAHSHGRSHTKDINDVLERFNPRRKNMNVPREITIKPALNGYIVTVGCQTVVFGTTEELIRHLDTYLNEPDVTEKVFLQTALHRGLAGDVGEEE